MAIPDLVMLLPGITGSTLSKDGQVLWGADLGGIWRLIKSGGQSLEALALTGGDDPEADDLDGVRATSLIPDLHLIPGLWKIDGYTKIRRRLVSEFGLKEGQNFFEFPYDWRRDNRTSARQLAKFARAKLTAWRQSSGAADAKLIFVTHSMGGLVARGFIDGLEGWRDTRALITLGTPHRGSLNALGFLANGFARSIGPLKLDLSQVARSFTALYQLLPAYGCVEKTDGSLSRVSEVDIPNIDRSRANAAVAFYEELERSRSENEALSDYRETGPLWYPIVGLFQPTMVSARIDGAGVTLQRTRASKEEGGDGTVPRASAMPLHLAHKGAGMFAQQAHGSLQNDDAVLTQIAGIISGLDVDYRAYRDELVKVSVDLDDAYSALAPVPLRARTSKRMPTLTAHIYDAQVPAGLEAVRLAVVQLRDNGDGELVGEVALPEGAYRAVVGGDANVAPAVDCFLVIGTGA